MSKKLSLNLAKVGDLVTWSSVYEAWMLAHGWNKSFYAENNLTRKSKRGIIVDKNPYKVFVFWENRELLAHCPEDLEPLR